MNNSLERLILGYKAFKQKYASEDQSFMQKLADDGQSPRNMVIACCDSRVDPSLIFQTDPGELFIARNVASIVPPYEADEKHHGTSAALEFAICYLNVENLIIMGHSHCAGINARLNKQSLHQNDFISSWVSVINFEDTNLNSNDATKLALIQSHQNCLTFPWIKERLNKTLAIHLWFFDIETTQIEYYDFQKRIFLPLT